jgi:thiol-disulfide isomerase/thioredoxin
MRFLTIFIFLISNSFANADIGVNNLVINKKLIKYDNITFINDQNNEINLIDYQGNVVLLNFWATWCAPCKEEMPSLDFLQKNENLKNLQIFPINIGKEKKGKAIKFFKELNIKNLNLYFDSPVTLAKKFKLRGIPTTIIFNKKGEEIARIIGSTDFGDQKFIEWLKSYD